MEPADIDWKKEEWRFVRDDLYEHFNAPKWVDLSAPSPLGASPCSVPRDEAWFCRPDCRHPKTAEDFLRLPSSTPPSGQSKVKLAKAWSSPLGERNHNKSSTDNNNNNNNAQRDANLKRRGGALPPSRDSPKSKPLTAKKKFREDLENQDPNLLPATPGRAAKETIKSSAERPQQPPVPERPLKSTLSARNLFAGNGKDILSQISEFCHEIKRLAMPRGGGGGGCGEGEDKNRKTTQNEDLNTMEEKGVEPLLAPGEDVGSIKKKKKQGRVAGKEGLENLRVPPEPRKKAIENSLLPQEVRSCPPTPQRFPSPLGPWRKATNIAPAKASLKPGGPPERGILGELVHNKEEVEVQAFVDGSSSSSSNIIFNSSPASAEGKSVDLFWLFKPCSYLGGR